MEYTVHHARTRPELQGLWNGPAWSAAETLRIEHYHPASSDHRPQVEARALYDRDGIYVIFDVRDRYVRSVNTEYQSPVYTDSCVEFFVQPKPGQGYFNFEMNCGGALLLRHVTNPARVGKELRQSTPVDKALAGEMRVFHSLPARVEPEIAAPTDWRVEYFAPFRLFERYVGPLGEMPGQVWRANFYKCGDQTSHPHWGSWAPIGERLNFHQPDRFGSILFQ